MTDLLDKAKSRPERWYPTCVLRQKRTHFLQAVAPGGALPYAGFGQEFASVATEKLTLQQKWTSSHGRDEWRDIEVVDA